MRVEYATDGIRPHDLFWRCVHCCLVSKNVHTTSFWMGRRVLFLMVWHVVGNGGRFRDGGWLKVLLPFSLSCKLKYRVGPWFYSIFISVPYLLIVLHGPNFCYISFDLFQLGPSIEIDYIFRFQFNPHSSNFWIGLNPLIYSV